MCVLPQTGAKEKLLLPVGALNLVDGLFGRDQSGSRFILSQTVTASLIR